MTKSNKKTSCSNYHAEWKKKNITKITVEFNKNKESDMELLEFLRGAEPSMQAHIKYLLNKEKQELEKEEQKRR